MAECTCPTTREVVRADGTKLLETTFPRDPWRHAEICDVHTLEKRLADPNNPLRKLGERIAREREELALGIIMGTIKGE